MIKVKIAHCVRFADICVGSSLYFMCHVLFVLLCFVLVCLEVGLFWLGFRVRSVLRLLTELAHLTLPLLPDLGLRLLATWSLHGSLLPSHHG